MSDGDEAPDFDVNRAASLVGKSVLVGLTYVNTAGDVVEQVQFFGHVAAVDPTMVTLKLESGEDFTLPPALEAFEPAESGEYRLHSTGQVVVDPDLLSTWTITAPSENDDERG
jgi:hypothetical protein